jgi:hypothetical protein
MILVKNLPTVQLGTVPFVPRHLLQLATSNVRAQTRSPLSLIDVGVSAGRKGATENYDVISVGGKPTPAGGRESERGGDLKMIFESTKTSRDAMLTHTFTPTQGAISLDDTVELRMTSNCRSYKGFRPKSNNVRPFKYTIDPQGSVVWVDNPSPSQRWCKSPRERCLG